jgi:multidrug efflux system outer membrane protein
MLLVVLAAGCSSQRPLLSEGREFVPPAAWSVPLPAAGDALDAAWWATFGDPLLPRLISAALGNSTDIGLSKANLQEARALRNQVAAGLSPALSGSLGAQRSSRTSTPPRIFTAALDASWEADLFGSTGHGVAAQDALVRASAADLSSARASVAAEVALAYLDLRSAQARAIIASENLASQEQTLQIARWREQAGLASSLDVEQATATVEQTRAEIPALEASVAISIHAIGVLTGQPPAALLDTLTPSLGVPTLSAVQAEPPAPTLGRRPDVLAAEERLQAAAQLAAQADADRAPSFTLTASAAWQSLTLGSLGSIAAARSIVASLTAPLFDGGLRDARLAQRQAQFEAARQQYRATLLAALQEVEDALVSVQADRGRLAALRTSQEAARNASMLATQRYQGGVIDFLTVLETQRTLLAVQDGVAVAQARLAQDQVRLFKALGGGAETPS